MATNNQMYQTLIIEHDRSPRNYKRLDAPFRRLTSSVFNVLIRPL